MYRDFKYRNTMIKNAITLYYNTYNAKYCPQKLNTNTYNNNASNTSNITSSKNNCIQDTHPHLSYPYKISLTIEKNGFSCINITPVEQKAPFRDLSPIKDKVRAASLSYKEVGGINLMSTGGGLGGSNMSGSVNGNMGISPNNGYASVNYSSTYHNTKSRNQFVLNSLKVLRVSENFLPPLQHFKEYNRVNS